MLRIQTQISISILIDKYLNEEKFKSQNVHIEKNEYIRYHSSVSVSLSTPSINMFSTTLYPRSYFLSRERVKTKYFLLYIESIFQ